MSAAIRTRQRRLGRPSALTLLALAGAALHAPLGGQTDDEARLRALFTDLSRSARVEITAPGLWIQDGRLEGVADDSVRVVENGMLVPVGLGEIESVAVETDRKWLGAAGGAAAGVLVGGSFGLMVGSFGCHTQEECEREGNRTARDGAVVVGVLGAVVGALFGRSRVRWKRVFP